MSYSLPWTVRILLAIAWIPLAICLRKNFTVNRRLWSFFDFKSSPTKTAHKGIKSSDVVIEKPRNLWFRLFIPTTATATATATTSTATLPVIIFIHGGGFCFFTADSALYDTICRRLALELHAVIASVNYRLAPEHKFPSQHEDCFDTLKFVDENFDDHFPAYADPSRCFLLGDSAGANLIHHLAIKASEHEFKRLKISGLISIQPFFGGEERTGAETRLVGAPVLNMELTDFYWKAYLPNGSDRDHPAANVFGPDSADITRVNLPPVLLCVGGLDILQDWQRGYSEGLKKYGKEVHLVEYPSAIHGFYGLPAFYPECSVFNKEMKYFIEHQSAGHNVSFA